MGNITQKNKPTNRTPTNRTPTNNECVSNNLVTSPIIERVISTNGNNFSVTLNYKTISLNSPKRFMVNVANGMVASTCTLNFITIENNIYLSLEPFGGYIFSASIVYSVRLTPKTLFRPSYTRDLKLDELMFYISKNDLKEYEHMDGSLLFLFERKVTQNLTAAPQQQTLIRPPSVSSQQRSAQPTLVLPQQRSSQSSSTLLQQTLERQSSVSSQQRSAQPTLVLPPQRSSQSSSTLLQQTLVRPSSVSSQQRSAQPSAASTQQGLKGKLKFEEIQRSSDNSFAYGKFRLTVSELGNLAQARAPLFSFYNMQIGFTVSKNKRNNANESLRVILYHNDLSGGSLTMESKLISCISRNPIVKKVNRSNIRNKNTCSDMIRWNQLFTSPNVFVFNDSCVIEVEIKIEKNRMPTVQAGGQNNSSRMKHSKVRANEQRSSSGMECPICMDEMANKPKSSTLCGHIFCTPCITRSLLTKQTCPLCNKPVSTGSLRPIFLS